MKTTEEEWLDRYPEMRLVCTATEDCPHPKSAVDPDCGNHEDWMT